jgi:Na+/H+ antiporter NhaD/arsenite permease-like protein
MFSSLLARQGVRFGYLDFLKLGVTVAIPTLCAALLGLSLVL